VVVNKINAVQKKKLDHNLRPHDLIILAKSLIKISRGFDVTKESNLRREKLNQLM
jgi:hypothetical protein